MADSSGSSRPLQRIAEGVELTKRMLAHAESLAEETVAAAVFVYTDALKETAWDPPAHLKGRVIYATRSEEERVALVDDQKQAIKVPSVDLTRMGQVKVAVFLALSQGLVQGGDRVVCLAGAREAGSLDMVLVMEIGREFDVFSGGGDADPLSSSEGEPISDVSPEVLARVVEVAADLGSEGREGKAVGALFVVGDSEKVVPLTRQRILNPFHGYPEDKRNVLDIQLEETIKELATVDGAFVIRGDGVVLSSGTYLKTTSVPEDSLPRGLGARHQAAAAITSVTHCFAVTVSQSTGTVTVFRRGRIVTEIEKPTKSRQG
ncbi:MAG: diadenylate cyclase [Planctomycetota bacterium]